MMLVAGVNHRGASLDVRERLAHLPHEVAGALERLTRQADVREAVLLSTCNRTEFYLVDGEAPAVPAVWALLSERLGADAAAYGYVRHDREAAAHLFRVAAGLDSMIVGEAQIHGQVREAWETSRDASGAVLNRLFQTALQVAGRVRAETGIGRGAASVSSASVQLAKKIFGSLQGRRAMVLGAGEMSELALECLAAEGVVAAVVANRTYERARTLAERVGARAIQYDEFWGALAQVDLVVCATASPRPVVTAELARKALKKRPDRPLCLIDMAVPRDVEPAVGEIDNVFLYDMDDLRSVVSSTLEQRKGEVAQAEALVAAEVERFWSWVAGLEVVPALTRFRAHVDALRERELARAMRRLDHLPPAERAAIEAFSKSLMNKFLHEPTVRLREAAAGGQGLGAVDALRYLFALDQPPGGGVEAPSPAPIGAANARAERTTNEER